MWGILVALASGALMSLQGVFNTEVTKQSSIWAAAGWVQATAFLTCVALYFFNGRGEIMSMFSMDKKYMLLGGVMGAFITWTVIKSMDGLGPAKATLLIVVTQILVSYLVEVFGLFGVEKVGFEWRKLLGAAIAIGGIIIFRW
ncbi:MAG: DMT family transporter [Lachnoclostridium sp.]|nr:DMT family transporter [Lachnoclostridium sp.]